MHGNSYSAFLLSKLVPVVGHLEEESLGMEEKMVKDVQNHVDVIVGCAANTRFDERSVLLSAAFRPHFLRPV